MRAFFKFIAYAVLILVIALIGFGVWGFKTSNGMVNNGAAFLEGKGYQSVRVVNQGTETCADREMSVTYKGEVNGQEKTAVLCIDVLSPSRVRFQ